MPVYVIKELSKPEPGAFVARGAIAQLFKTRHFETIVAGPADTGKTFGCCQYIDALCWKYPRSQHVIAKKTYRSLVGTVLPTWKKVIEQYHDRIKVFGGSKPEWYDYPNGSRVWCAGLDKVGRALSSERDTIYINQAEQLLLDDWEVLTTRASGRGAVMPYTRLFGDCNPDAPTHWILKRRTIVILNSKHEDNPTLYDESGKLLPGEKVANRMRVLDDLTGHRYLRLRLGRWVQAEGVVYESFERSRNLITKMPDGWQHWRKIRSIDFGFNNPFVCQWWAIDPDGRMYLYREIYMSYRIVEDHVHGVWEQERDENGNPVGERKLVHLGINHYSEGEEYEVTLSDHDREDRATADRHGCYTSAAYKDIDSGIQIIESRLRPAGDGRARLFILEGCTVEYDSRLAEKKLPTSTVEEFDAYLWPKGVDGKPVKAKPVDKDNHGMDAMRYVGNYLDGNQQIEVVISDQPEVFN